LQLVASMFSLQATTTKSAEVAQSLQQAMSRVTAVARIHERLYRTTDIGTVDLAAYLGDICQDFAGLAPQCEIKYEPDGPIPIATDRAVRVALLATELVTNAAKHAYAGDKQGPIFIALARIDDATIRLSVRDEGAGLPATFDAEHGVGLGIRIVQALVTQTGAKLAVHRNQRGSEFVIEMPSEPEVAARDVN